MALIDLSRATEQIPNFNNANLAILSGIVDAASDVVTRYCNQEFEKKTYDELCDGSGYLNLLLPRFPVTKILRIAFNLANCIMVRNTDSGVSRASYRLDGDDSTPALPNNLYLDSWKNGVETSIIISVKTGSTSLNGTPGTTFSMLTFNDLATAISSFSAYGWTATALGLFTTWPVQELRPPQGAFDCHLQGTAFMQLHSWNLNSFEVNPDVGEVAAPMGFTRGYRNYRVIAEYGYDEVPAAVQQATAELAAAVYLDRGRNPNLQSENLTGYSWSASAQKTFDNLSLAAKYGLSLYRNRRIGKFKLY